MIRPFAIVTISNAILAISAAVVLGISAYVEHTVSFIPLILHCGADDRLVKSTYIAPPTFTMLS